MRAFFMNSRVNPSLINSDAHSESSGMSKSLQLSPKALNTFDITIVLTHTSVRLFSVHLFQFVPVADETVLNKAMDHLARLP